MYAGYNKRAMSCISHACMMPNSFFLLLLLHFKQRISWSLIVPLLLPSMCFAFILQYYLPLLWTFFNMVTPVWLISFCCYKMVLQISHTPCGWFVAFVKNNVINKPTWPNQSQSEWKQIHISLEKLCFTYFAHQLQNAESFLSVVHRLLM